MYCNTFGPSELEGGGSVFRATVSFYRISEDGSSLSFVRAKSVPEGIHYATFYVEPGRRWFWHVPARDRLCIVYSTDTRRLNLVHARSNIALEELTLD